MIKGRAWSVCQAWCLVLPLICVCSKHTSNWGKLDEGLREVAKHKEKSWVWTEGREECHSPRHCSCEAELTVLTSEHLGNKDTTPWVHLPTPLLEAARDQSRKRVKNHLETPLFSSCRLKCTFCNAYSTQCLMLSTNGTLAKFAGIVHGWCCGFTFTWNWKARTQVSIPESEGVPEMPPVTSAHFLLTLFLIPRNLQDKRLRLKIPFNQIFQLASGSV